MAKSSAPKRPCVFIGSSFEGFEVAKLFHQTLLADAEAVLWRQPGVFGPGDFTLESLEAALDRFPYAVLVLSPDDVTHSRGNAEISPRDNVIFEFGLFVGRHGRRSAFLAVPDTDDLRLPSDVWGLTPVRYNATSVDGLPRYDVTEACEEIVRKLKQPRPAPKPVPPPPSPFWDVLSDTIVILYGVEPDGGAQKHPRYRISLRDLETAWEVKTFLDRRYPSKQVWPIPTTASGWEQLMRSGADLVVVGGFVTNAEFAAHRSEYENFFRLKMGRLCAVDGQRVHLPEFKSNVLPLPDRRNPEAVEDFPTEFTNRDFGFVFNGMLHIYNRDRRVIAIAGVKGHGTRAAASYIIDEGGGIDACLKGRLLTSTDTLELAVSTKVAADVIDAIEPVGIFLNGQLLHTGKRDHSVPCELGHPCDGCDFGVARAKTHRDIIPPAILARQTKAIIFDLDDTLLDTFNSLIVPLEIQAAKAIVASGAKEVDATNVASALLHWRRHNPANLDKELRNTMPGLTRHHLAIRKRMLTKVSLDNVVLSPEVMQLLRRLRNRYDLYLLTAGAVGFQNRKIDQLEIRRLFVKTIIVSDSSADAKAAAIRELAEDRGYTKENVLIVGNRLDNEIAAGNLLGMPTVWIRQGEGCELKPGVATAQPDFTLGHVLEMASLLG